jgi:predicted amidophosphoribosyltransferase
MGEGSTLPSARVWGRAVRGWLAEAGDAVVSVFFPAGCRICDKLLLRASRVPFCQECLDSFQRPPEKTCEICGQALGWMTARQEEPLACRACQQKSYAFERATGFMKGAMKNAILLLKWERMEPLGAWFAGRLADMVDREPGLLAAEVVVPVPLHRDREHQRGYNQAALISKPLARKLGLPHKAVLLMRTRPRPDKQVLSLEERWESVRGAFATRPGSQVDNKRVLLVVM